jgi:hypothetical protein
MISTSGNFHILSACKRAKYRGYLPLTYKLTSPYTNQTYIRQAYQTPADLFEQMSSSLLNSNLQSNLS